MRPDLGWGFATGVWIPGSSTGSVIATCVWGEGSSSIGSISMTGVGDGVGRGLGP
jgi:hypothetical protein